MALEMKSVCERCQVTLPQDGRAFICSFECTFCAPCAEAMQNNCPNCGGKLVMRSRRTKA